MQVIGWFEIVAGAGILAFWVIALSARAVPEVEAGDRAIWFHVAAECLLGLALIAGGLAVLGGEDAWRRALAAAAAGGLVYSTINSPGHYARSGSWGVVAAFGVLTLVGLGAISVLIRG